MASYRGNYIGGLMQKPGRQDDYYDPNDPFGSGDDASYKVDDPFGSDSAESKKATGDPFGVRPSYSQPGDEQNTQPNTLPVEMPDPEGDGAGGDMPDPTTSIAGPSTGPDTSSYNSDGYAKPQYVPPAGSYGQAPSGWDQTKWNDPNHQSPKYAVGRILVAAGDLRNPANRQKAISDIQKAYPGAQFNGKDKISIDGGKTWVDIFGGASSGIYSPAWQPDEGSDGGSKIQQWAGGGGMPDGMPPLPESASDQTTRSEYNSLLRQYLRRQQPTGSTN